MTETLIYSVGVNALWQAGLLALGVAVAIRVFKITAPKYRALLWSAAFFASALVPLAAFVPGAAIGTSMITATTSTAFGASTAQLAAPASEVAIGGAETSPKVFTYGDLLAPVGGLIWLGGAAFGLFKLIAGGVVVARLRRVAEPVANDAPGVSASIKLRSHDGVSAPLATGVLRPVILLPQIMADDLAAPSTQHALAHELAHIRRGDLIANIAEQIILCLFWWNPVLHAMRARIAENREMACDDHAVGLMRDANGYAAAIIECAERAIGSTQKHVSAHALSATGRRSSLSKRITRLVADGYSARGNVRPGSVIMACAVMLLSAALIVGATPRVALAAGPASDARSEMLTDAQRLGHFLVEAIAEGDGARAESLVAAGADINAVLEKNGTPLIAAVNRQSYSLAAWLIALGADVDQYARYDETALISAVRTGNIHMVRLLIEAGADVNLSAATQEGVFRSPIGEARRMKRDDLISLLVASGAGE